MTHWIGQLQRSKKLSTGVVEIRHVLAPQVTVAVEASTEIPHLECVLIKYLKLTSVSSSLDWKKPISIEELEYAVRELRMKTAMLSFVKRAFDG